MSKKQLIIQDILQGFPVRSEGGELKVTTTLVVNWGGPREQGELPDSFMRVAPGDELEIVVSSDQQKSASLWLRSGSDDPLLLSGDEVVREPNGTCVRVDVPDGGRILEVNREIPPDSRALRYSLETGVLGLLLLDDPPVGDGLPGTLSASKP